MDDPLDKLHTIQHVFVEEKFGFHCLINSQLLQKQCVNKKKEYNYGATCMEGFIMF